MAIIVAYIVVVLLGLLIFRLTTQEGHLRSFLLPIALLQLVGSLAIPVLLGFVVAFGQLNIVDIYVELDRNGVIDQGRLRQIRGDHFVDEQSLPGYLGRGFDTVVFIGFGISVFCFATGIGLLGIWWRLGQSETTVRHFSKLVPISED
jgi:hypothetical protein